MCELKFVSPGGLTKDKIITVVKSRLYLFPTIIPGRWEREEFSTERSFTNASPEEKPMQASDQRVLGPGRN